MGTHEGGTKSHVTMRQKLGLNGYKEHMAAIGARGGKAKVAKGFSVTRKKAANAQELHEGVQPSERPTNDTD